MQVLQKGSDRTFSEYRLCIQESRHQGGRGNMGQGVDAEAECQKLGTQLDELLIERQKVITCAQRHNLRQQA